MKKETPRLLHAVLFVAATAFLVYHGGNDPEVRIRATVIISLIIWLAALVGLLSRRDVEIHEKLSWVVTIIVLNGIGGLLYFTFGPRAEQEQDQNEFLDHLDPNAKPFRVEGTSWNPILGENRLTKGEGLNPASEDLKKED